MKKFFLATALLFFVLTGFASPESELEARLPEVFAKSAAHYRALDAAVTPLMKGADGTDRMPRGWNKWRTGKDEYDMRSALDWTAGHFSGSFWYLFEATGDGFFKDRATAWMDILAPNAKVTSNHDVGFIMYCSYGNARRILGTDKYDALLLEAADSLSQRYSEKLGLIRSWGEKDETKNFLVIPDNLMNLELLEWATGARGERIAPTGRPRYHEIARSHADVTMRHHFRPDGGCFHVLDYDETTGRVREIRRGQGASCETAWARGESWAIYGYTMMYRTSGYVRYLDFAKKLADWAIGHPNMPADGIPHWDYGAPGEERDSSAGAIMASALLELSQYVGTNPEQSNNPTIQQSNNSPASRYRAFAVKQLTSLASPAYFSAGGEVGHFLLKHGVGHKPGGKEIDTPLNYGDYYFLEALLRFRNLKAREKACAETLGAAALRALPEKAGLPKGEFDRRFRMEPATARELAEKALTAPIPETPDELYREFVTTGNRTRYQDCRSARIRNLAALALAERREGKGRYLARLEDYLAAVCDMKSWVLPAHDYSENGSGTFRGVWISTDLCSTELAALLACIVQEFGARLRPGTVARIKAEVERRVFGPVRREAPCCLFGETAIDGVLERHHWWIHGENNWNAVCWDNVNCAAAGLVDDLSDRVGFAAAADRATVCYLRGLADDGYCSEGSGYWNYGYGHHLFLGRLLRELTAGRFNLLRRPKERLAAAYVRSYTLREGISPTFSDGSGAAGPLLLEISDTFWSDLPKGLPPMSEFPEGQVWLFRDPEGLSVAFKGGHNKEHHNHNDLGSYYLVDRDRFVAGDCGREVYTARTFGAHRYESKMINSYGHPVPVVGGRLQSFGSQFRAKVVSKRFDGNGGEVVLDLKGGYEVKSLRTLTRTFVYDRKAKTFAVRDHAEFAEPTAFEDCYVTLGGEVKVKVEGEGLRSEVKGRTAVKMLAKPEETIVNPGLPSPHRFAWTFETPVTAADVEFVFKGE